MVLYKDLLVRVKKDFPELRFRAGVRFSYRPPRTVMYEQPLERVKNGEQNFDRVAGNLDLAIGSEQIFETDWRELTDEKSSSSRLGEVGKLGVDNSPQWSENEQNYYNLQLLHEIGHALLAHRDYKLDVERVKMECEAWEKARELAEKYQVEYDEEFVQDELDTYRDWLHKKAKCPKCGNTRYQDANGRYHCLLCENF